MKILKYGLIIVTAAGLSNGLMAVTEQKKDKKTTPKHTKQLETKKHAVSKKHETKYAKPVHKTATHTKKEVTYKQATPAQTPKTTAGKTTQSTASKLGSWFGGGAATTAAATTAAAGKTVHHRGPEDWHKKHHFPKGWNEGFTGKWVGKEWLFAGHNLAWWHENEPTYYKDVVRPEATKAGVPRQHFEK